MTEQLTEEQAVALVEVIKQKHKGGGGELAKLLENLDSKMVDEDSLKLLTKIYGECINKADCPCGSGKPYRNCCKNDFVLIARDDKKQKKEERAEAKETKWVVKVGISAEGRIKLAPVGDDPKVSLEVLSKVLNDAARGVERDFIIQSAMQETFQQMNAMAQRQQPGPMPGPRIVRK